MNTYDLKDGRTIRLSQVEMLGQVKSMVIKTGDAPPRREGYCFRIHFMHGREVHVEHLDQAAAESERQSIISAIDIRDNR